MLRRGRWKFVHSPADPDQLYDLEADPEELDNLGTAPAHAAIIADFSAEVAARWNLPRLHEQVLASQRRRRLVDQALGQGQRRSWDYQPWRDASQQYMRNTMKLDDLEARARFP
jgi:choline-sulfatase